MEVDSLQAVLDRVQKAGAKISMPVTDQFHGMREFAFEDGDGYTITIAQKLGWALSATLMREGCAHPHIRIAANVWGTRRIEMTGRYQQPACAPPSTWSTSPVT